MIGEWNKMRSRTSVIWKKERDEKSEEVGRRKNVSNLVRMESMYICGDDMEIGEWNETE